VTSVAGTSLFDTLAEEAAAESPLWAESLLPAADRDATAVFSALCPGAALALGVETIYEGYLAHYGKPRLFRPADDDTALLLGDYLYAHGLVRVAATGDAAAVHDLAELISLCAQGQADGRDGAAAAWAATAALLGRGELAAAREALRDHADPAPLEAAARAACGDGPVDAALRLHAGLAGQAAPARPVR
jgi:hypothetical protein